MLSQVRRLACSHVRWLETCPHASKTCKNLMTVTYGHAPPRRRPHVITVGASRPVRCFMLDSVSATSTSGFSATAASACSRSGPASGATYCSTYMRMVAPDEPVPARGRPAALGARLLCVGMHDLVQAVLICGVSPQDVLGEPSPLTPDHMR
jgi:hypothetical protein